MGSSVVETTGKKKLSGTAKGYIILVGLVVLSWAIFKVLTPGNFGSPANMLSYFQASLIATVGAVGFYFVMVMGMFDFSIGANIMLSAIVGCVFASRFGMGYAGLIIGSVLTGTIVGLLNGIFYVKLRIPSMIVTTGLALIYESVANYIAGGVEQTLPSNLRAFGQMPWNIIRRVCYQHYFLWFHRDGRTDSDPGRYYRSGTVNYHHADHKSRKRRDCQVNRGRKCNERGKITGKKSLQVLRYHEGSSECVF